MIGPRMDAVTTDKMELHLRISAKTVASMQQVEVEALVEKYLAEGVFVEPKGEDICPNCGSDMMGAFCRKCNQAAENDELLDKDENEEDREVDDHSDSEDADDYGPFDKEDDEEFPSEASTPAFAEIFSKFLAELGTPDAEIFLHLYLLESVIENETGIDDPLTQDLAKTAADWAGKTEEYVQTLWAEKPFSQKDFDEIFEEWLADSNPPTSGEYEEAFLELRKVEGEYISIVHDRFEDVRTAPGKRNIPILFKKTQIPAGLFLLTLRKRNRNLQRILETIVELRRDFLDAPTRDDALRIIREQPLELIDVASETGINISIISRHFSTKAVFTPHGIFMLGDLVSPKSRTGEDITVSALHDKILKVIKQGDSEGRFFSDQKVAETLKEEYEINASREYVQKIRKKYAILNSRQRRAKGDG